MPKRKNSKPEEDVLYGEVGRGVI